MELERDIHAGALGRSGKEALDVDDGVSFRDDYGSLDDVLELPDIPRPGVATQRLHRGGSDRADEFLAALGARFQKRRYEERDVARPLPERGDANRHHRQPVEEVGAEAAVLDLRLE